MQSTLLLVIFPLCLASDFGADVLETDNFACANSVANADKKFPGLTRCFGQASLFFSTIHDICTPKCRSLTVNAASFLVKECKLGKPDKNSPVITNNHLVYSVWSDKEAVDIICSENAHQNTCLQDFSQASVELSSRKMCRTKYSKHCTPCNKRIFNKFKKTPYAIPSVYYQSVLDPDALIKKLGSVCHWH